LFDFVEIGILATFCEVSGVTEFRLIAGLVTPVGCSWLGSYLCCLLRWNCFKHYM